MRSGVLEGNMFCLASQLRIVLVVVVMMMVMVSVVVVVVVVWWMEGVDVAGGESVPSIQR